MTDHIQLKFTAKQQVICLTGGWLQIQLARRRDRISDISPAAGRALAPAGDRRQVVARPARL